MLEKVGAGLAEEAVRGHGHNLPGPARLASGSAARWAQARAQEPAESAVTSQR